MLFWPCVVSGATCWLQLLPLLADSALQMSKRSNGVKELTELLRNGRFGLSLSFSLTDRQSSINKLASEMLPWSPFGPMAINKVPRRPWLKQSCWFDLMYPSYSSLGPKWNIMLIKGKEKKPTYWGQWLTNNQIYICFEMLMENRAACNSLASSPWW